MIPALSAVIPSAGLSSRMHQFKPLLSFGDLSMVEVVIRLFQSCGIQDILVVTGFNHDLLEPIVQKAGARALFNPDFETGMLGSIQTGAAQVSPESLGFFLLPVDIPAIRPGTIRTLASAFKPPFETIILPEFDKICGHPPLIPARLIPRILAMDPTSNLGELLLSQKQHQVRHPVHDRGTLMDADTKDAYDLLLEKYRRMDIPDTEECGSIIRALLPGEDAIQSHLALVAAVAEKLARAIENNPNHTAETPGPVRLDKQLIQAAALLHDIKRKEKNHAAAAGRFLKNLGFDRVADIVADHMTLVPGENLTEKEIVYFADKLCNGSQVDPCYTQRFTDKIKQAPGAERQIVHRYETTRHIQARIEAAAGCSIRTLLQ
ncbi:MAG: NTP transferase domain-containing protein [Proteobacteria bacterium]|nr:HD domain-containing protein [Desulfobacula sp.]MBU3954418.1 NTP transferase domain-containing protein [Pseudomonadota bacterium]MBU4129864.1 NTP transferase domain-containing protein [Pseudomonadota bacterium]